MIDMLYSDWADMAMLVLSIAVCVVVVHQFRLHDERVWLRALLFPLGLLAVHYGADVWDNFAPGHVDRESAAMILMRPANASLLAFLAFDLSRDTIEALNLRFWKRSSSLKHALLKKLRVH